MKIEKIYLDMDGVLADFDEGVIRLLGLTPMLQENKTPEYEKELWERAREVGHFYLKLKPLNNAIVWYHLLRKKYGDRVEILTGIPKEDKGIVTAGEDKIEWVHTILNDKDVVVNIVLREEKKNFIGGKAYVLVDDFSTTTIEWDENGGTSILFNEDINLFEELEKIENM